MNKYRLTLTRRVSDGNDVKTFTIFSQDYEPLQATVHDDCKVAGIVQVETQATDNIFATLSLVNGNGEVIPLSSQVCRKTEKGFSASTNTPVPAMKGNLSLSANFVKVSTTDCYQANLSLTEKGTMSTTRAAILAANRPVNAALKRAQREVRDFRNLNVKRAEIDRTYAALHEPASAENN